jgi:hypothetical protein
MYMYSWFSGVFLCTKVAIGSQFDFHSLKAEIKIQINSVLIFKLSRNLGG